MPAGAFHTRRVSHSLTELTNDVRAAIADHEDATDAQLIANVSKHYGKKKTKVQFGQAIKTYEN